MTFKSLCITSVAKSCLTLCDPMDCSTTGFAVLHYLPKFAQTHVYWVDDPSQSSHPLSPLHLLPSIFPSISVFSNESALPTGGLGCRKYWASASGSVLPMNIQGWFPLRLTGLISLLSKWLSRVFTSKTVSRHQFFGAQLSLWSNSPIYLWLLEKP